MVFKEMKNANGGEVNLDSIPLPQSLFQTAATEFPISTSHVMLEGYADLMLSEVVVLLLFEAGIDKAESSVITTLRLLLKQSIQNAGRTLSQCHCHFLTQDEYNTSHYALRPGIKQPLYQLRALMDAESNPTVNTTTKEASPSMKEKQQSNREFLSVSSIGVLYD